MVYGKSFLFSFVQFPFFFLKFRVIRFLNSCRLDKVSLVPPTENAEEEVGEDEERNVIHTFYPWAAIRMWSVHKKYIRIRLSEYLSPEVVKHFICLFLQKHLLI